MNRMRVLRLAAAYCAAVAFVAPIWAEYDGGLGTAENPYLINTPEQLNSIGLNTSHWSAHFRLTSDINMGIYTGIQYHIIGNSTTKFTGTFDGNGHVISNLTYFTTANVNYVGLFGYTYYAYITNLGLENVVIESAGSHLGGLAGSAVSGVFYGCYVTGYVTGTGYNSCLLYTSPSPRD